MLINCGHVDDPETPVRIGQVIVLQSALMDDQEQREELLVQTILALASIKETEQ